MNQKFIGMDIGGTTFSSVIFDETMEPINKSRKREIYEIHSTIDLLDSLAEQINSLVRDDSEIIAGIGISCPGPLDAKNGIILETPNLKLLQNINLKREIENRCNQTVFIENDANLFTLGEWHLENNNTGIQGGITLGTGLGFGLVIDGKIYKGAHGLATEYAISPVEDGNWETTVSIAAIKKMCIEKFGKEMHPIDLYEMAVKGDDTAKSIWKTYGENLGRALSHFINMLDPHKISIGGGVSGAFIFFEEGMKSTIKQFSPSFVKNNTIIFESKHKELSSMIGAGLLAKQSLKENI